MKVIVCKEDWTSKTCTSCGTRNKDLGNLKWFKCPNHECDRDLNGARNILITYLTQDKQCKSNYIELGGQWE